MQHFFEIVRQFILEKRYRRICEIGAASGGNTDRLLAIEGIEVAITDAFYDADLSDKYAQDKGVTVGKGLSLHVLPRSNEPFDCVLIDGDHNWYTVFNEPRYIEDRGLLREEGTIFLHDISWPYGRRDMYYNPADIPSEHVHPNEKAGILRGQSDLTHNGSGVNANFMSAVYEGGPRNGVLTAIEDFLKIHGNKYIFSRFDEEHRLGVLSKRT